MVRPQSARTAVVDEEQFAQMYPASCKSAAFGDQAMMRFARNDPNKRFGLEARFFARITLHRSTVSSSPYGLRKRGEKGW